MPTMAAITIKKNDGITDNVYSILTASGGDKSPAIWRADGNVGYPGQKPTLSYKTSPSQDGLTRRIEGTFTYPSVYTDTATSTTKVLKKAYFNFTGSLPTDMPSADANEFGAQLGNLLASTLIKQCNQVGFAAT